MNGRATCQSLDGLQQLQKQKPGPNLLHLRNHAHHALLMHQTHLRVGCLRRNSRAACRIPVRITLYSTITYTAVQGRTDGEG